MGEVKNKGEEIIVTLQRKRNKEGIHKFLGEIARRDRPKFKKK